jgi:hypothetical protein
MNLIRCGRIEVRLGDSGSVQSNRVNPDIEGVVNSDKIEKLTPIDTKIKKPTQLVDLYVFDFDKFTWWT